MAAEGTTVDPDGPADGVAAYWKFAFILSLTGFMGVMIWLSTKYDRPAQWLALGLTGVAISTFATFYSKSSDIDTRMRTAIAAAVVLTYLVFFALVVFSPSLQQASGSYKARQEEQAKQASQGTNGGDDGENASQTDGDSDTIPADLFGSFTWVTAAVVAFYFGGRTLEQVAKNVRGNTSSESGSTVAGGTTTH